PGLRVRGGADRGGRGGAGARKVSRRDQRGVAVECPRRDAATRVFEGSAYGQRSPRRVGSRRHKLSRETFAMRLGFVSAILSDLALEEVLKFAADEGFACVELMCWPPGKAERRYAGVCHIDVSDFNDEHEQHVRDLLRIHGVAVSG